MKTRILGIVLTVVLAIGGAVALTGYVRTADARALAGAQPVRAYVAVRAVPKGAKADAVRAAVRITELPRAAAVDGRVTSLAQLDGLVANSRIEPGEQLLRARFSDPAAVAKQSATSLPPGLQAITLKLPLEQAVGGTLQAGDLAGVFVTDGNDVKDAIAKQSFHKVLVLAVKDGAAVVPKKAAADQQPEEVQLVTLAMNGQDATTAVWGQRWGTVWLSEETATSKAGTSDVVRGACTATCKKVHR